MVQDPVLGCGPVARVLSDRFQIAVKGGVDVLDRTPKMWPLTVMTADDLDRLSASVQVTGQRLDAILERFHRTHPSRMILLVDFLSSPASPDFGLPEKVQL